MTRCYGWKKRYCGWLDTLTDKLALSKQLQMCPEQVIRVTWHELREPLLVDSAQVYTCRKDMLYCYWAVIGVTSLTR